MSLILMADLPQHLAESGWDVHVVSSPGNELNELARDSRVSVHALPMERNPRLRADLRSLWAWLRLLRELTPDVVFVGTPKAGMLAMFAAAMTRCRHRIYHVRGLRLETTKGLQRVALTILERLTLAASTRSLAVSDSLRRELVTQRLAPATKLTTIGRGSSNGVDSQRFHPAETSQQPTRVAIGLADGVPIIGFVGRLHRDKGLDNLIEASRVLFHRGTRHQLLIVGGVDNEDGSRLAQLLDDLPVHTVVVGSVPDTAPLYRLMDVLCLPTMREGFPNVVLEAAATAVPVVTTDATGAVDSVVDGVTGMIVPKGDPMALADALEKALSDDVWRLSAGAEGRKMVEAHFTRSHVHAQLRAFLLDCVRGDKQTEALAHALDKTKSPTFPRTLRFFSVTKLHRDAAGALRAHTPLMSNEEWAPFLHHFDQIEVISRVQPGIVDDSGYVLDHPRITVTEIPYYEGTWDYFLRIRVIRRFLRSRIDSTDVAYGVWAPTQIVPFVSKAVERIGGTLLMRLIGDPETVVRAIAPRPVARIMARMARLATAKSVLRASAVVYVTMGTLQKKYPASRGAITLARTNLRLAPEVLSIRRGGYDEFVNGAPASIIAVGSQQQSYKGHDLLIEAVAQLVRIGYEVTLTLVGQGAMHQALVDQAAAASLAVHFIPRAGSTVDVAGLIAEHDIFIMPSRTEGMPKALLEAMAVGTFALGSSVGGITEVLAEEYRFPPNSVEAVTERLRYYLDERTAVPDAVQAQRRSFENIWENHSGPTVLARFLERWTGREGSDQRGERDDA